MACGADNSLCREFENYLTSKGVTAKLTNRRFKVNSIEEAFENGQVILMQNPTILYDMNGNQYRSDKEGHAVVVTGVTSDGNLIVSSWGGQYIVKPSDYPGFNLFDWNTWDDFFNYEVVTYE